jgi:hypothetical protein
MPAASLSLVTTKIVFRLCQISIGTRDKGEKDVKDKAEKFWLQQLSIWECHLWI